MTVRIRYVVSTDRVGSMCEDIIEYDELPTEEEMEEDLKIHISNYTESYYEVLED